MHAYDQTNTDPIFADPSYATPSHSVSANNDAPASQHIVFDPWNGRPTAALLKSIATPGANLSAADNKSSENNNALDTITPRAPRTAPLMRSKQTEEQYTIRVRGLSRQSSAKRTVDPQNPYEPSPMEIVQDLIAAATATDSDKPVLASASWALYRSALLWHLAPKRSINAIYESAYHLLATTKNPCQPKAPGQREKKTFAGNDFSVIINTLGAIDKERRAWGSKTAFWLQAGIAAGARGGEWLHTEWIDRNNFKLMIPNSKRKTSEAAFARLKANEANNTDTSAPRNVYEQEEAAEKERALNALNPYSTSYNTSYSNPYSDPSLENTFEDDDFDEEDEPVAYASHRIVTIDPNDAIYVDLHLESIRKHNRLQTKRSSVSEEEAFKRYYERIRKTLRRACDIAFKGKRYYRLYNTRSQFSANRKVNHDLGAVATMMGHTNTRTTMSNYGSRAAGLKGHRSHAPNTQADHDFTIDAPKPMDFAKDSASSQAEQGDANAAYP